MVGYYTLASSAVGFDKVPPALRKRLPKYPVPVARIGELAVNISRKGQGLGSALLLDALERIANASEQMAVWAIVVDPIDQNAAAFYLHYGFEPLLDSETLFLTLKDAVAWLADNVD